MDGKGLGAVPSPCNQWGVATTILQIQQIRRARRGPCTAAAGDGVPPPRSPKPWRGCTGRSGQAGCSPGRAPHCTAAGASPPAAASEARPPFLLELGALPGLTAAQPLAPPPALTLGHCPRLVCAPARPRPCTCTCSSAPPPARSSCGSTCWTRWPAARWCRATATPCCARRTRATQARCVHWRGRAGAGLEGSRGRQEDWLGRAPHEKTRPSLDATTDRPPTTQNCPQHRSLSVAVDVVLMHSSSARQHQLSPSSVCLPAFRHARRRRGCLCLAPGPTSLPLATHTPPPTPR